MNSELILEVYGFGRQRIEWEDREIELRSDNEDLEENERGVWGRSDLGAKQ